MGKEFNGITVDGKSVESYLMDKSDKEVGEVIQHARRVHLKKRRTKYMETKEKNGRVQTAPQSELNKMNLKANIEKAKTRVEKVLAHLLAEHALKSKQVAEAMQIHASDAASMLRGIYKSNLGRYMIREGNASKGYIFHMDAGGLELTPEQALKIYRQKTKKAEYVDITQPIPEEQPEPIEPIKHIREPLDVNLKVSGDIKITFAFKWEK